MEILEDLEMLILQNEDDFDRGKGKYILQNFIKEKKSKQLALLRVSSSAEFKVWDELFGILAWKYILTKSGDMYLDSEEVYNELKDKFELKRK